MKGLSEFSVVLWVSAVEECPLNGVPLKCFYAVICINKHFLFVSLNNVRNGMLFMIIIKITLLCNTHPTHIGTASHTFCSAV